MQALMGKENHPKIMDLHEKVQLLQPGPDLEIDVAPVKDYITRFDICIKVAVGENQVELFHQAFCKWDFEIKRGWSSSNHISMG